MNTDLIINTGLQFISIPVKLNDSLIKSVDGVFSERIVEENEQGVIYSLIHPYYWKDENIYIDFDSINEEAFDNMGNVISEKIRFNYVSEIIDEDIYKVRGEEVLDLYTGHWIPLPYFRIREDPMAPFHHGPEDWCRVFLSKVEDPESNHTHIVTLAFDTNTIDIDSSSDYKKPRVSDASDNGSERFKCVLDKRSTPQFFTSEEIHDWMFNLYWLNPNKVKRTTHKLRYMAAYHVFLDLLNECDGLPEIGLLRGKKSIDVGLVLDIGNSRTCGLIAEKNRPYDSEPFDFTNVRKLQIRNLSSPHEVMDQPFDMQVAFAEERFGNQSVAMFDDVFEWPSLVRIGNEAVQLTSIFESEDSMATMSSPKRYLWSTSESEVPWIKVDRDGRKGYHGDVEIRKYALYGIAEFVKNNGELIKANEQDRFFAATESHYSKASLMTFAIYEILLHALSQINSRQFREDQGNSTYRRILKDIVLTCPTAMTVQEQYSLRKAAFDAVELLKLTMSQKMDVGEITVHPKLPSLDPLTDNAAEWKYDEATCSQLSYLYGEIVHKFKKDTNLFFELNGKKNSKQKTDDSKTINIASIDIGGGTSDLMICKYSYDSSSDLPFVRPEPIFWEGFNVAGDDIVKRIIEYVFLPSIENHLRDLGGKEIGGTLNKLFGPNVGGTSAKERIVRKQFANQIAAIFAFEALEYVRFNNSQVETITFDSIFKNYPKPDSGLIERIDEIISRKTDVKFSLSDVPFTLIPKQINHGIKDVLGDVLNQLSFLISKFDCDIILLTGRPSRLPIIKEILSSNLLFSPSKMVSLGDYRFGAWYPMANAMGYVGDPKSTVSVGALIAYLNTHGALPGMRIDMSQLNRIGSTVNYIGVMNQDANRISAEHVIISPSQHQGSFAFRGEPVILGMKQLKSEDWIASPLYSFEFESIESKDRFLNDEFVYPLKVTIQRFGDIGEFIDFDSIEVEDAEGKIVEGKYFSLKFRTAPKSISHWKDSGSFIVNIE